ncbi:MAG TPA: GNAT family N-acetyltransferase [Chloroflexia bacterium]|nr:GNAT family N-acetyltransferase [Chloroflexia bacterium]
MSPLLIRPARATDRAAVLAFCRQTWSWGDYIDDAWDRWLADPTGLFAVGEADGRVVGVDKLTLLTPGEAFFEGLRIDPAVRGRGYAQQFQRHMLAAARRTGARVVRFLTAVDNTPVHKMAERDGFRRGPRLFPWESPAQPAAGASAPALHPLRPGLDADRAWQARQPGPWWAPSAELLSHNWHLQAWDAGCWARQLAAGQLFAAPPDHPGPPPGLVALLPDAGRPDTGWLAGLACVPEPAGVATLVAAAGAVAAARGYTTLRAILPRHPALDVGLPAAGWAADEGTALLVFEKDLTTTEAAAGSA